MAEFTITDELVFPTRNDVSPVLNEGKRFSEETVNRWITKLSTDFVESGFTVPTSDADLVIPVAGGIAYVDGYLVETTASVDVTAIDNSTSFLFLRLLKTSDLVTEAVLAVEASSTVVGSEILLAIFTASGGVITNAADARNTNKFGLTPSTLIYSTRF